MDFNKNWALCAFVVFDVLNLDTVVLVRSQGASVLLSIFFVLEQ